MKNKKKTLVFFVAVFLVVGSIVASYVFLSREYKLEDIKKVKIGDRIVSVDLAIAEEERNLGLSFRPSLAEGQGMLFVFEEPDTYSFWMKDMNFPIDMIFIDQNKKIVTIKENALPESYPESFGPTRDVLYVLEVASGFSLKNNIKEGDLVEFLY